MLHAQVCRYGGSSRILMIRPSTFSIAACDLSDSSWGIAVASKFLAVGAVVPWARANAGAVATQSYANTSYGRLALDLMEAGTTAEAALRALLESDPEMQSRQVGLVDRNGGSATFTGEACFSWAGGITGPGYAVQGNILQSEQVVPTMAEAFEGSTGNLAQRLYQALSAGDRAGGDRRGRQSAALLVVKPRGGYAGFNDRWLDLRVDDHNNPIHRLGELLHLHELYFGDSPKEDKLALDAEVLRNLQIVLLKTGYYQGPIQKGWTDEIRSGLSAFIGNENFEERIDIQAEWIDRPVYEYILKRFGAAHD
jgi:uncharacterized Ntn-hydrolase superfamily protein